MTVPDLTEAALIGCVASIGSVLRSAGTELLSSGVPSTRKMEACIETVAVRM